MKYLDEYRDAEGARSFAKAISEVTTRPWSIMEVCGGQTHSIVRFGVDDLEGRVHGGAAVHVLAPHP